jgi:hypothetical protein
MGATSRASSIGVRQHPSACCTWLEPRLCRKRTLCYQSIKPSTDQGYHGEQGEYTLYAEDGEILRLDYFDVGVIVGSSYPVADFTRGLIEVEHLSSRDCLSLAPS